MFVVSKRFYIVMIALLIGQINSSSSQDLLSFQGDFGETIHGLGDIWDLRISPDERYMATCGSHGGFLWDLEGDLSQPINHFPAYKITLENGLYHYYIGFIHDIKWDTSGEYIMFSSPGSDFLYNIQFNANKEMNKTNESVSTSQISNFVPYEQDLLSTLDDDKYITVENDKAIVWDSETQTALHEFQGYYKSYRIAFMNAGEAIVTINRFQANIWDANTFELIRSFPLLSDDYLGFPLEMRYLPNKAQLVTFMRRFGTSQIRMFDINTGELVRQIDSHTYGKVKAFSNDRNKAFIEVQPNDRLLNLESWQYETEFDLADRSSIASYYRYAHVVFSPNDQHVAALHIDGEELLVDILNTETGTLQNTIRLPYESVAFFDPRIFFSEDGSKFMVTQGKRTDVFDFTTHEQINMFEYPLEEDYISVTYPSSDLNELTLVYTDRIEHWDITNNILINKLESMLLRGGDYVTFLPGGDLISLYRDRTQGGSNLVQYSLTQGNIVKNVNFFPYRTISHVPTVFSKNKEWFLGLDQFDISLNYIPTLEEYKTYFSNTNWNVSTAAINDEKKKIYVGRHDGSIIEWDIPDYTNIDDWNLYK